MYCCAKRGQIERPLKGRRKKSTSVVEAENTMKTRNDAACLWAMIPIPVTVRRDARSSIPKKKNNLFPLRKSCFPRRRFACLVIATDGMQPHTHMDDDYVEIPDRTVDAACSKSSDNARRHPDNAWRYFQFRTEDRYFVSLINSPLNLILIFSQKKKPFAKDFFFRILKLKCIYCSYRLELIWCYWKKIKTFSHIKIY